MEQLPNEDYGEILLEQMIQEQEKESPETMATHSRLASSALSRRVNHISGRI